MNARTCRPSRASRGHKFDIDSGWCVHGCGVRDDGLVISTRTGERVSPPASGLDVTEPRWVRETPW